MYRVSADVGGTFTDVVVADASGQLTLGKALTTPERSYAGFRAGLENAADQLGVDADHILRECHVLIYGTTRSTNAIVEGKVARTAFLTTAGFPNILHYRQGGKEGVFDLSKDPTPPYVPRKYTYEIPERVNAEGGIERPLDEDAVVAVIGQLRTREIEAVAVCLLWSTVNPFHEERIAALLDEHLPGVPYTLSSQLNPVIREYPRASSTCIDASLKPLMQKHLRDLESDLEEVGFSGQLFVSASSGGVMHAREIIERPIYSVKSGPAMAPLAGLAYSREEGTGDDIIICDTGGTTFDVSLVRAGGVKYSRETWLGGKWVGHNLGMSTVDVRSIGAGGGSVAWVDPGGLLRVGPRSAGSVPGPASYGRGGSDATVTDAAVVLGYIDPEQFLGGRMQLDAEAARAAVEVLATQLSMTVENTALGIIKLASEQMISAIREVTINDGINPRESIIVAGGGAAGLNIAPIAESLGCSRVLIPRTAGGLSACGAQYSDIVMDFGASCYSRTRAFDFPSVNKTLSNLRARATDFGEELSSHGIEAYRLTTFVEARYVGQQWEIEIPLGISAEMGDSDVGDLEEEFHSTHERLYAVREASSEVECINWKVRLVAPLESPSASQAVTRSDSVAVHRTTSAYFGGASRLETPVLRGAELASNHVVNGPAIIQEPTTTIVVYPGQTATLTPRGHYLIDTGITRS
jgi:N-methylhydantoinase A